jgi:hypothetical protein
MHGSRQASAKQPKPSGGIGESSRRRDPDEVAEATIFILP